MVAMLPLGTPARHCDVEGRRTGRISRRRPLRGAAALGPGVRGSGMTAASFGPRLDPQGGVTFRLWAPAAERVDLVLDDLRPMRAQSQGWFEATVPDAGPGMRYRFRIDGDLIAPDPASRFQPDDVH